VGTSLAALSGLSYWYPGAETPALRDVSLALDGGLTVVAGPSGGGKSTLLRVLNGLVPHFHGGRIAGLAEVDGFDVRTTPTRRLARSVGFVFQDPELQTVYTVVDREVAFGLENLAVPSSEIPGRVEEALGQAGIPHLAGRGIATLSGGERQRVALASALALRPRLLVLDEPTSQLDPDGAALLLDAALRLAAEGRVVVVAEHRLDHLVPVAAGLVMVRDGSPERADPTAWRAPSPARRAERATAPGPVAWSVDGVDAGFQGRPVVEGVTLSGGLGEVVVLTGPNGGGKTTLLRVIAGVLAPLVGHVERRPGRIAYLPQNPTSLLHRPTVLDEVALTLGRAGDRQPADEILEVLGLQAVAGRYPRDLSTGERQRAALAAVLAGTPTLVLLDEPTRGMDAFARAALQRLVQRLRDDGAAVVLATHDADLTAALADRVVRVADGRVAPIALDPPIGAHPALPREPGPPARSVDLLGWEGGG
jgi:energy-coupling factor transport system ATP-binding protein